MAALIDTHAHLDDDKFADQVAAVVQRAQQAGLTRIVSIATTRASSARCLELAQRFSLVVPTAGIHPNHATEAAADDWDAVAGLIARPEVVGVGETGLDRHWDFTPFPVQEDYFARHLDQARQHQKPVIIHCREARSDVLAMLRADFDRHGPLRGVMHSFSEDVATAEACLAMGLFISFAGMLTYKNAQTLRDVAATIPADRVLVETDSPYLTPIPKRGQRNEPAYVRHTAECLAQVLGVTLDEVAALTSRNAQALFRLT